MKPGHTIDMKGRHIFEVRELSRRFVGYLTEDDLRKMVIEKHPQLFLWDYDNRLTELSEEWLEKLVPGQIVPDPNDIDIATCPCGCCYVAMHWKGDFGKPIIVLHRHH